MSIGTYRSYENGSRPITLDAARILGDAFGVDVQALAADALKGLTLEGDTADLEFVGDAAVGLWRDNTFDHQATKYKPRVTVASRGVKVKRRSIRIADESMNRVFKRGWYAIFENKGSDDPRDYPEGSFLVIDRFRGSLVERSVRRVERSHKDYCTLACYSTDKLFSERIICPAKSKDETIIVVGKVTGGSFDL